MNSKIARAAWTLALAAALAPSPAHAQSAAPESAQPKRFVGSSMFMLANTVSMPDPPSFYQLNYGYRLTPRDIISLEAITWTYHAPLGIPYGESFGSAEEAYPGYVREYGLGVAYQRYLRGNLYSAVHGLPLVQNYFDSDRELIQRGFQLFFTLRFGYHLELFRNRLFLEPSIAFTHWPVNTNVPEAFAELDDRWPNYFLFEPGLHFGVKF